MQVTPKYLRELIAKAKDNGASCEDIRELESRLKQMESGGSSTGSPTYTFKCTDSQGRVLIIQSTTPIMPGDEDDFAGLLPRPMKKKVLS